MIRLNIPSRSNEVKEFTTIKSTRAYLKFIWDVDKLYSYSFVNEDGIKVTLCYESKKNMLRDHDGAYAANYYRS